MSKTLLTLSAEHGGQRFGPFGKGTLSIGTDSGRCQVVLDKTSGAAPVHATLTDTGAGWTLQPAQIGAALFVRKPNGRVAPITTGSPIESGDAIVIGTQSGPALTVSRAAVAASNKTAGPKGRIPGSQHLNKNAFQREIQRQALSNFTRNPVGREIYRFWTRWRSGSFLRPRYVIGAVVGLVGMLGVGCLGCLGVVGAALGLR